MSDRPPFATDALRAWVNGAGYSWRRSQNALAALDAFDAAIRGEEQVTPADVHALRPETEGL